MKSSIRSIFIPPVISPDHQKVATLVTEELEKQGFLLLNTISTADLVVVIGGDGSLLHALHSYGFPPTPFIGINSGTLGFLQEIEVEHFRDFVSSLKKGNYTLSRLPLLEFTAGDITGVAFNEVVIERASAQTAHLSIAVNNVVFDQFIGDGLIISTPQGSSAYALAAGGAFLSDGLAAMQLVPINPHNTVAYRSLHSPLILDIDATIEIKNRHTDHRPVRIFADGREFEASVESAHIKLSKRRATFLRGETYNYFSVLARKFIK